MASNDLIAVSSMIGKGLSSKTLTTSSVDQIAPAANHGQIIKSAVACNTSTSAVTFTVTFTLSGGSAKTLINACTLAPNESTVLIELVGMTVGPGDKVSALASAATSIDLTITGVENS